MRLSLFVAVTIILVAATVPSVIADSDTQIFLPNALRSSTDQQQSTATPSQTATATSTTESTSIPTSTETLSPTTSVTPTPTETATLTPTPTETPPCQIAPEDSLFNNPLDIPLDNTTSVLDFVSYPDGDTEDRVRYSVTGMNPNPGLSGGQAELVIVASCFGEGKDNIQFFTGGQTYACGDTLVDQVVTADSDTGQITITAVGGQCTYVQWVLTGTATRTN